MEFGRFALAMVGHFLASLLYVLQRLHIVNAVVDTSSILEHREELRELWEKRMMADENQSSPSSTVAEPKSSKPLSEEETEEKISETKVEHKMSNGHAIPIENNNFEADANANHVHVSKPVENGVVSSSTVEEHQNDGVDSLEEDNADEYVEEKTYTSTLEQTLVMKEVKESISETIVHSTTEEVVVKEASAPVLDSTLEATSSECDGTVAETSADPESDSTQEIVEVSEVSSSEDLLVKIETETTQEVMITREEVISSSTSAAAVSRHDQELVESFAEAQVKGIEVPEPTDENGDGFVTLEECLPHVDSTEGVKEVEGEHSAEEQEVSSTNGAEEHPSHAVSADASRDVAKPTPTTPEIEQFVKSGGVKRIIPGVQKTEQPYSTCTTETKIAMEIREMREREEELRLMREQALLSPVVSPVPPKSPRSPSPAQKEGQSPTPQGPGYRVSSVFGHKGTTSPQPPTPVPEEKLFKNFNKETAVEREIRLARDREEELRKQKGLPPREDDSYVKPSQVKSSQVRVFGKMVGTNNSSIKQAATAKIQMEIEEQTRREMALRETGSIQTISEERTDAKVAKLKPQENGSTPPAYTNGNSHSHTNGNYTNGRSSPDVGPYKRTTPSPTGARPASIFSSTNSAPKSSISMHKFISSKGKESTFSGPRNGSIGLSPKEETRAVVPPPMVKLKRNLSVESKIQQEILEMKQREEELKKLHTRNLDSSSMDGNDIEHEMNQKNNLVEYEIGNGISEEEISPRHNKLIAQWEQRIQKAES